VEPSELALVARGERHGFSRSATNGRSSASRFFDPPGVDGAFAQAAAIAATWHVVAPPP